MPSRLQSPLTIFGTTENENQRLQQSSLPVRTFRGELSTVFENYLHIPPEKAFIFVPFAENFFSSGSRWDWHFGECSQKKSFPVVADEKGIFRSISRKNSKNNSAQLGQNFQNQLPDNLSGI